MTRDENDEYNSVHNDSSHNPSETSSVRNSAKRTIDRGLDGGYWSRISVGEMLSDNKPKRTRRTVDHLNLSSFTGNFYDNEESNSTFPGELLREA